MRRFIPILFLLVIGGCLNDVLDESYSDMNEAIKDGAIDRGWIPEWIPKTAINIKELHNLDTNQSALAFDIPSQTIWELPEQCNSITENEVELSRYQRPWLPNESKLKINFKVYLCDTNSIGISEYVAISLDGRQGLHWRQ